MSDGGLEGAATTGPVRRWWARRGTGPIDRRQVLDALALRHDANWGFRFGLMQALSVVIAVVGLTGDSAAVVIGAMLVAPLMTPLMALAASLAMGWYRRILRSASVVVIASFGSILLAYVLAAVVPGDGITEEVLRRTSPGTGDLVVALAAGVAGAYGTVRSDVSSSLPGVAVAVALVPPLATIGVTLAAEERGLAAGAGLLFMTNFSAIVLAGVCVFLLTGFVPARRLSLARGRLLVGAAAVVAMVGLVTVVLAGRTLEAARAAEDVAAARRLTVAWLGGSGLDLDGLDVSDGRVAVAVSGPEPPPDVSLLVGQLTDLFGAATDVEGRWSQRTSISASGSALDQLDAARLESVVEDWLATGGTPAEAFTVDMGTDDGVLALQVTGPVVAPTSALLEVLLAQRLGLRVPVVVESTVATASDHTTAESEVIDATVARWAAERGLRVGDVQVTGDGIRVLVDGAEAPASSAELTAALSAALARPVEVELSYRSTLEVPDEPFVWPLDCAPPPEGPVAGPEMTEPGGFSESPAGQWLAARLADTGFDGAPFVADGTSFVAAHADGLIAVWVTAIPDGLETGLERRIDAPTSATGPRGREVRTGDAGGARVVAVLVPSAPRPQGPSTCLPSSVRLDAWFLGLLAAVAADPVPATTSIPVTEPGADGSLPLAEHVRRVGAAAGLRIGVPAVAPSGTAGAERVVLRLDEADLTLEVTAAPPSLDEPGRLRAGGLTLRPASGSAVEGAEESAIEQLVAALATTPWLGVGTG